MTPDSLVIALRGFTRRRPFRPFLIEFMSGDRVLVTHPEVVDRVGELFVYRGPDRGHRVFEASSVCQLLDIPSGTNTASQG